MSRYVSDASPLYE